MAITKEDLEKFYNSPMANSIMQGLCANPSLVYRPNMIDINSANIVSHFLKIIAGLQIEMGKMMTGRAD